MVVVVVGGGGDSSSVDKSPANMGEATAITQRIAKACSQRKGGWSVLVEELIREAEYTTSPLGGGSGSSRLDSSVGAARLDLSPLSASARREGAPGASTMATLRLGARTIESRGAAASSRGNREGGGGAGGSAVVPIVVLQRLLAKRGVPLTPHDLRVLSSHFAPPSATEGNLTIDLGLLGSEVGAY